MILDTGKSKRGICTAVAAAVVVACGVVVVGYDVAGQIDGEEVVADHVRIALHDRDSTALLDAAEEGG